MITGDNEITAKAIAMECNIIQDDYEDGVINGKDFYERIGGVVCAHCKKDKDCKCPKNQKDYDE